MPSASLSPIAIALIERYGFTLSFPEAAEALSFPSTGAASAARQRGRFPCRVIDLGGRLGVAATEIARFLDSGVPASASVSAPLVAARSHARAGRPSKKEQVEAAAQGITVRELRQRQRAEGGAQ